MSKYLVTIEERIHYFLEVDADSSEEAQEQVELDMQDPGWEDPRNSEVQGQVVFDIQLLNER